MNFVIRWDAMTVLIGRRAPLVLFEPRARTVTIVRYVGSSQALHMKEERFCRRSINDFTGSERTTKRLQTQQAADIPPVCCFGQLVRRRWWLCSARGVELGL